MSFVDSFAESNFVEYLVARLELKNQPRPKSNEWSRVGNTVGALALRLNLLTEAQIDKTLEKQDVQGGYFGELALQAGYLNPMQISRLLDIQNLHDQLFLAEQLVVAGAIDVPTLVSHLSAFLSDSVVAES
jgi:hypothetical protein